MKQKVAVYLICFLCASVLIVSAWLKLWPIESFEYKIASTGLFSWTISAIVSRLIISLEFALGFLLLFAFRLKFTIISTVSLLFVFSFYLLFTLGNEDISKDCGCMGESFIMGSEIAILKNLMMMIVLVIAYFYRFDDAVKLKCVPLIVVAISSILVFIAEPVASQSSIHNEFTQHYRLNLDPIYESDYGDKIEKPVRDIRHDKLLLVFVSATCEHCKLALKKIDAFKSRNPELPIYLFVNGDEKDINILMERANTTNIPFSRLNGSLFVETAGLKLPVILFYNNGMVENRFDYLNLSQETLEIWLNQ